VQFIAQDGQFNVKSWTGSWWANYDHLSLNRTKTELL